MTSSRGTKGQAIKGSELLSKEVQDQFGDSFKELMDKMTKQKLPPKDALGLTGNMLEGIYAQAYRLYNTGKYGEATQLFRLLVLLDATEPKYILGLAACFHMIKEYKTAVQIYMMCAMVDPESPLPHYHCSDCLLQMKDALSASVSLEMAIERAGNKPEYAKIKERSLMSLENLKKGQVAESQPPEGI